MNLNTFEDFKKWINTHDNSYKYMLLDRMRSDCDYVINQCGCTPASMKHLWATNDPALHIKCMKYLWNSLLTKPEWLSMEQIKEYEFLFLGEKVS